ncbi:hypothetical protein [Solidesulfovibrio sp.]
MTRPLGKLRKLEFTSFRGLGVKSYPLEMKGKNCIVVGGNGKGKSCIADGIELLFGGSVQRFDNFDPLKNVYSEANVCVSVVDVNGNSLALTIDESGVLSLDPTDKGAYVDYPSADCFVLRRSRILDFIHSKPSERYVSFARLLGIESFENKRKCFEDFKAELSANKKKLEEEYRVSLAAFRQDDGHVPRSFLELLRYSSDVSKKMGYGDVGSVEDCVSILEEIKKVGNVDDQRRYDALLLARHAASQITFPLLEDNIVFLKDQWDELLVAASECVDCKSEAIVQGGIEFFVKNSTEIKCPLCESVVDPLLLLARLKERKITLENYFNKKKKYESSLNSVCDWILSAKRSISLSLESGFSVFDLSTEVVLRKIQREIDDILKNDLQSYVDKMNGDVSFVLGLCDRLKFVKTNCISSFDFEIDELKKRIDSKLFAMHTLLFNLKTNFLSIYSQEKRIGENASLLSLVDSVRKAFNDSYKKTLHEIVNKFEDSVYDVYKFLHDGHSEPMECTGVELEPSKGKGWLLDLAICFFEKEGICKPEHYLSEGHLDSLGLSVYLASVLSFNTEGTLLVLDDIVSSVDKEHQHRVANLLVSRFKKYQLLVLTHDERWADLIISKAVAIENGSLWKTKKIASWHPEVGPVESTFRNNWDYIYENLTPDKYLLLGGLLRKLTEYFLKSVLLKFKMYLQYKESNEYTVHEMINLSKVDEKDERSKKVNKVRIGHGLGPAKNLRGIVYGALLLEVDESATYSVDDVDKYILHSFGAPSLLNELVHDKFVVAQFMEVRDFAYSLKSIEAILYSHNFCA